MFAADKTLRLQGLTLGFVTAVTPMPGIIMLLRSVTSCAPLDPAPSTESPYGTIAEARLGIYRRTVCLDSAANLHAHKRLKTAGLRRWDAVGSGFRERAMALFEGTPLDPDDEWMPAVVPHPGNAFFTVSTGHVGLGRAHAQLGDLVVVFRGLSMPLTLRKRGTAREERYQMIGPCYLHGVMDGEAMRPVADSRELLREFIID